MAAGKGDKEDSQLLETGPLLPPDSPSSVGPWWETGRSCFPQFPRRSRLPEIRGLILCSFTRQS